MALIKPPLSPAHRACGNDPTLVFPDGEDHEQWSARVGLTERVKAVFALRMPYIISYNERKIEEHLLTLGWSNTMPGPDLLGIMDIPFKSRTLK